MTLRCKLCGHSENDELVDNPVTPDNICLSCHQLLHEDMDYMLGTPYDGPGEGDSTDHDVCI